jgi:TetR/AcrR family transcriptional repressor of nem operon
MGRPREFDRSDALAKAIEVFWARGYDATSMTDLQKALGIGRQSLYSTFGGKDTLFEEAFRNYIKMGEASMSQALGPEAGLTEVRAFLLGTAARLCQSSPRMGCMVVNSCVERAPHDERAAELTSGAIRNQRALIARALSNARDRGDLSSHADPDVLASFITCQLAGLSVLSRAGASKDELLRIANTALTALTAGADVRDA